jgi:hypothetical protein
LHPVSIKFLAEEAIEFGEPIAITYYYTGTQMNKLKFVIEDYAKGRSDTIKIDQLCIDSECKQGYYLYKRFFSNNFIDPSSELSSLARSFQEKAFIDKLKDEYKKWFFAKLSYIEAQNIRMYLIGLQPNK